MTEVPLAEAFRYPGVASAYRHRPPYPDQVFSLLTGLITDTPRTVLDLGAGAGALARPLAALVDHVDAVDISAAMVEEGRRQPGGDAPNLRWIVGPAESAPLGGPYALVTAGASMHWMRWQETFERLAGVMTGGALLAIGGHGHQDPPGLEEIIVRYSRSPDYDPDVRLVDALAQAGLFEPVGEARPRRPRSASGPRTTSSTCTPRRAWPASGWSRPRRRPSTARWPRPSPRSRPTAGSTCRSPPASAGEQ
jgi:SAM-dependent methyltransferase